MIISDVLYNQERQACLIYIVASFHLSTQTGGTILSRCIVLYVFWASTEVNQRRDWAVDTMDLEITE